MTKRKTEKLGRGLRAIIDKNALEIPASASGILELPLAEILPNPHQPRRDMDPRALEELQDSIRENGVLQPVLVTRMPNGYQLVAGERRYRAALAVGLETIPAFIREDLDEAALRELAMVENIQREDLNPLDLALGYQQLLDELGLTQEQLARKMGKSRSDVANMLRLLKLPGVIRLSLKQGSIRVGHAKVLLSLKDEEEQIYYWKQTIRRHLSVRQLEELLARPARGTRKRVKSVPPPEVEAVEQRLREALATEVALRHNPRGHGRIEIRYASEEELNRLLELFGA